MKKMPCLFKRDFEKSRHVYNEVTSGCEWVIAGEGLATRKFDGTACLVRDGKLYKRYYAKRGKIPPANFEPCVEPDLITGHHPGWVPVVEGDPSSQWHWQAWQNQKDYVTNGTYELCGPKLQGNPESNHVLSEVGDPNMHILIRHGTYLLAGIARTFDGLREYLEINSHLEGIVFHHPDGRMCKIRRGDFGFEWPVRGN